MVGQTSSGERAYAIPTVVPWLVDESWLGLQRTVRIEVVTTRQQLHTDQKRELLLS